METFSEQSPFSRRAREHDDGQHVGGNLILWIAVIAVLIGLNFVSWSFCMWVFGQPEQPINYRLLTKLDRLDPIHGFTAVTAPRGKFLSAKEFYAEAYPFNDTELRTYNGILKRHYVKNYFERDDVRFLSGEFTVLSVQKMDKDDVFTSGYVIRGQSTVFPDAFVDFALPSPEAPETFAIEPGEVIKIEESSTCAAVLNIDRREDGSMVFTAVPLVEREFIFGEEAVIDVKAFPIIQIDPERWPISDEVDPLEIKPASLSATATEAIEAENIPEEKTNKTKPSP